MKRLFLSPLFLERIHWYGWRQSILQAVQTIGMGFQCGGQQADAHQTSFLTIRFCLFGICRHCEKIPNPM